MPKFPHPKRSQARIVNDSSQEVGPKLRGSKVGPTTAVVNDTYQGTKSLTVEQTTQDSRTRRTHGPWMETQNFEPPCALSVPVCCGCHAMAPSIPNALTPCGYRVNGLQIAKVARSFRTSSQISNCTLSTSCRNPTVGNAVTITTTKTTTEH
jgi:hypothetical protein